MISLLTGLLLLDSATGNLNFLDIGLEYRKEAEVYYWANPVTVQLVYHIPQPPSVDQFAKPRCDFALSARRSLAARFRDQFPHIAALEYYQDNCRQFEQDDKFSQDTERSCYSCFHISSDNDPFYLECLMFLQMRHICDKAIPTRRKRETRDSYVLSNIAVMLASGAKTQDDRITAKFRSEHELQKENVNFQLMFLNTFRWQMSLSELWMLQYLQSEPEMFAKILINLSNILPKTRTLTEEKLNTKLSQEWSIESTERNESHVTINVTFTSFNQDFTAQLFKFRFLPVKFGSDFYVLGDEDNFSLKCNSTVVRLEQFDAHQVEKQKYVHDSPCHQNHDSSPMQQCMNAILNKLPNAHGICLKNALPLQNVNDFYFTLDSRVWFPDTVTLIHECDGTRVIEDDVKPNSILVPQCLCKYTVNGAPIPKTKICKSAQILHQIHSNFTLRNNEPFFLGEIQESRDGEWHSSATNDLSQKALVESELIEEYFKKKLEEEASTSAGFSMKWTLSSLWLLLPLLGIILVGGIFCFRCKTGGSGFGGAPRPVFINYCQHNGAEESVDLRPHAQFVGQPRVVSWPHSTKV